MEFLPKYHSDEVSGELLDERTEFDGRSLKVY
jgi:hypothetical protein